MSSRPLSGVRVLEAANYVSGPFAGLALADLGGDVLKLEPPTGDPYRRFGPQDESGGVMFRAINRNKRSEALDLGSPKGVERLAELLAESDALISNWRPGVADRFGLSEDTVRQRWPRLVWVRVSGYGQTGPMAAKPTFDSIIQARTGVVSALDPPELLPMYLADKVTAMITVQAVLAALLERATSGQGAIVDVSMLDSLAYLNSADVAAGHLTPGRPDERVDQQMRVPRVLPTRDGEIVISPVSGSQLKRALVAAGLEDRVEELKSIPDRTAMSAHFYRIMAAKLETDATETWVARFTQADVPVTAVFDVEEHISDPQVVHNQLYSLAVDSDGRPSRRIRYPALFEGNPVETAGLPPPALISASNP
jgi:crotonobetainyl-CoA:carnitine CoA-transferase CaiB-like acyl-CoA transferase